MNSFFWANAIEMCVLRLKIFKCLFRCKKKRKHLQYVFMKVAGGCIKSCNCNLNHREQFGAFILVKIEHRWPPLWLALRQNCSHLFGSLLSLPQAYWKVSTLFSAHTHTHTRAHTFIQTVHPSLALFFFAPSPFSMPLLLYSASLGCLWQWHTVVLCDEPTSGAAVPHKGASTFNRY